MRTTKLVFMAAVTALASPPLLAQTGLRMSVASPDDGALPPASHGSGIDGGGAALPAPRLADVRMIDPYALTGAAGDRGGLAAPLTRAYSDVLPAEGFSAGSFNLYDNQASGLSLDVTPASRVQTDSTLAGQAHVLGDYSIRGDLYQAYGRFTAFGSLGWKRQTSAGGLNVGDPRFGAIGGLYRFSPGTTGGLSYDRRQNVFYGGNYGGGLTAFMTHKLGQGLKLQGYVIKGLAEGSPNWGAGALFSVGF